MFNSLSVGIENIFYENQWYNLKYKTEASYDVVQAILVLHVYKERLYLHEILTSFDAIAICVLLALAHWKIWRLLFYIHNIYKTAEKADT